MVIDAPPQPPSQDELDALIREARERQLRRRLSAATAITVATAVGLGSYALTSGGSPGTAPVSRHAAGLANCPLNGVGLSLQTQGSATQSVTFLTVRNPNHLTCSISTPVVFEITQNGHRVPISGNPVRVRLHAILRRTRSSYAPAPPGGIWWGNWCGSPKGLRMTARLGSRSLATRFNVLPVCLGSSQQSAVTAAN